MKTLIYYSAAGICLIAAAISFTFWSDGGASSHREAPMMMTDPTADITDVYAFVSPDDASTVTLIMNVVPFEEPSGGPNFYRFDDNVLYALRIDNDGDAREDIVYEFRFNTEIQDGSTFLYNTSTIDSPTDSDFNFRQTFSVTRVDSLRQNGTTTALTTTLGQNLTTPPENIGPKSTPGYEALADAAVHDISRDGQVFAGQRDDPFFVDLGAVFDLLTIRPGAPGNTGGGVDGVGGFNVHSIVLQVPIAELTADSETLTDSDDPDRVIGVWATSSRQSMTVYNGDGTKSTSGDWVQISRLGIPLINEVVVPLAFKDFFNSSQPRNDLENYGASDGPIFDPELPKLLNLLHGVEVPDAPRNDLLNLLIGFEGLNRPANTGGADVQPAEMLRLNMAVPPKVPGEDGFSIYGVLGGDIAGFPNGRRLYDDVTDIELRVMAGVLVDGFDMSPNNALGDGVSSNDRAFSTAFPYVSEPHQGFEHEHHPTGEAPTNTAIRGGDEVPESIGLLQNYPNPFNPSTSIRYELNDAMSVDLAVYDMQGRLVRTLVSGQQTSGTHEVQWDGRDASGQAVASGTYIYRVTTDDFMKAQKMVLVK